MDSGSENPEADEQNFQDFDSIYESAARCLQAGIRPSFNIIFAYPGEGTKERRETIDFMMDVCRRFPGAEFWTNIFTPYPGSPIMEQAEELGIRVPSSFEGWADFFPRYTVLPWLSGREHKRLQVMREYLRIAFDRVPIAADTRKRSTRLIQKALSLPARWRLDHDVYALSRGTVDQRHAEAQDGSAEARRGRKAAGTGWRARRRAEEAQSRVVLPAVRRAAVGRAALPAELGRAVAASWISKCR